MVVALLPALLLPLLLLLLLLLLPPPPLPTPLRQLLDLVLVVPFTADVVLPLTVCIGIGRPSTPGVGNGNFRMYVYLKSGTKTGFISTCA